MSLTAIRVTSRTTSTRAIKRILVVSIAVGAVLISLLALHSKAGSRESVPNALGSAQHAEIGSTAHADAAGLETTSFQLGAAAIPLLDGGQSCGIACALTAMTCILLIVVVVMVFLARYPALFHRLVDRGRRAVERLSEARNHVYLPSLTVLSISRT